MCSSAFGLSLERGSRLGRKRGRREREREKEREGEAAAELAVYFSAAKIFGAACEE